ncbi:MAG: hypothetical protein JXJ22_02460 [Bacteroidales bacterium]|nr:hypothetical protein [Bacteroidales bacterium]
MKSKRLLFIFCLVLTLFQVSRAQVYSERISKAYRINNNTTIEIINKYGKINLLTWNKDSVKFEIDLSIRTTNASKFNKLKNSISFDFTATDYYVVAKTTISSSQSVISDFLNTILPTDNQVTIDYTVYIPEYAILKVDNKFGDIYADNLNGNVNITLSNGNLKAGSFNGNSVIKINSGDGIINSIENGSIYVSYSDLQLKSTDRLTLDARSSRVNIDAAKYIKLESRRDRINIKKVDELYGDSYFSVLIIDELTKEFNYSLKYGNLSVDFIPKNFSFINLNGEYTDMDLLFERGSAYLLDISHHQDVYLNYPVQIARLEEKSLNAEDKQVLTFGKIGSGATNSKVKITAPKKCTINIIHK